MEPDVTPLEFAVDDADEVKRELQQIYQLAMHVRDDAHLDAILADVPDDALRAAIAVIVRPMIRKRRVER